MKNITLSKSNCVTVHTLNGKVVEFKAPELETN